MQNSGILKPLCAQLALIQQHVRTGLSVKGKVPVSVRLQGNKCKGSIGLLCPADTGSVHACIPQCIYNIVSECILSQLCDQAAVSAQLCSDCRNIGRCASADACKLFYFLEQAVPLRRNKVDQRFS